MCAQRSVQIPTDLFVDLCIYAYRHAEPDDLQYKRLRSGVNKKLEAIRKHQIYSQYKCGDTDEAREQARQDYIDLVGILVDYRWNMISDINVTHTLDGSLYEDPT
mgnify:CR=1 FL=1